jgi:hypothetical protein
MNNNCNDSGLGGDMNIDNIFFYEDNNNLSGNNQDDGMSLTAQRTFKNENDQMEINDQVQEGVQESAGASVLKQKRHRDKYTQIKVNVGIDEDLKMILEMVKNQD